MKNMTEEEYMEFITQLTGELSEIFIKLDWDVEIVNDSKGKILGMFAGDQKFLAETKAVLSLGGKQMQEITDESTIEVENGDE